MLSLRRLTTILTCALIAVGAGIVGVSTGRAADTAAPVMESAPIVTAAIRAVATAAAEDDAQAEVMTPVTGLPLGVSLAIADRAGLERLLPPVTTVIARRVIAAAPRGPPAV